MTLQAADVDTLPVNLAYAITDGPDHGTLDDSALPVVVYTPTSKHSGADGFTFRVADGPRTDTAPEVVNSLTARWLAGTSVMARALPPRYHGRKCRALAAARIHARVRT